MTPIIIAVVLGIFGGWVYAGFPLPRRRVLSPIKSEPRAIGRIRFRARAPERRGTAFSPAPALPRSSAAGTTESNVPSG
jgi:hypothetical protein